MTVGLIIGFFIGGICGVFLTSLLISWKKHDEHICSLKGGVVNDVTGNEEESPRSD